MTTLQTRTAVKRIWYASYGSNLSKKRFMCYIRGGRPPGSEIVNPGCRDNTPPEEDEPTSLDWEFYFAGYSTWWKGAGAFIRKHKDQKPTLGRMYLITDDQFNDVVIQENGRRVDGSRLVPPFEMLIEQDEIILENIPMYGRLIRIGQKSGNPILTFTSTKYDFEIGAPSEAYLKVIVAGIKETYPSMRESEICTYFQSTDGIRNRIRADQLQRWIAEVD